MSEKQQKINQKPVKPPEDNFDKPFFAYGIFKEGQIAHSKIKHCVDSVERDVEIKDCEMRIRDGIPFISKQKHEGYKTKGHIIYFIEGREEEAYKIISDTEPEDLYEWDVITLERDDKKDDVNVLMGKNPNRGFAVYGDDNDRYIDNFDGNMDPMFKDLIKFLNKESENMPHDNCDIFRLQMYYMMLWSAIDRYCILKYDSANFQLNNLKSLSEDEVFINSVNETDLPKIQKTIYSSRNTKPYYWNRNNPYFIINYYYGVRNNVVHRGKDRIAGKKLIEKSLNDLLKIFEKVIKKTFDE